MMTFGSLFSGIGGIDLGLERAGMTPLWQCEIEPYCRAVLRRHFPGVPCYDDVRLIDATAPRPDLICGGFPCQDISYAGKGAGLEGARSGLWYEFARIAETLRPSYLLIENVSALRSRGLDKVLRCLASVGYDAEWHCIPASSVGAPHRRDRVFVIAYTYGVVVENGRQSTNAPACGERDVADSRSERIATGLSGQESRGEGSSGVLDDSRLQDEIRRSSAATQWLVEPNVGRVAHGVPSRVHRIKSLGNAVVPQVAEVLGRAILQHAATRASS